MEMVLSIERLCQMSNPLPGNPKQKNNNLWHDPHGGFLSTNSHSSVIELPGHLDSVVLCHNTQPPTKKIAVFDLLEYILCCHYDIHHCTVSGCHFGKNCCVLHDLRADGLILRQKTKKNLLANSTPQNNNSEPILDRKILMRLALQCRLASP